MKVCYFNDELEPVKVFTNDLFGPATIVSPGTMQEFEVDMPEGCIVFIKRWPTKYILISYCDTSEDE